MSGSNHPRFVSVLAAGLLLTGCGDTPPESPTAASTAAVTRPSQVASIYALDFVGTAASGFGMNNAGDVVGRSYRDTGCGPFCLPPEDIVVWRGGNRIVLPSVPGQTTATQFPSFINNQGVIGGSVGDPPLNAQPAVWTPSGAGYTAQLIGALPGMPFASVAGFDDQGRMVGWSSTGGAIPTAAAPYMWSQGTGFANLATLGYPNEMPGGMSPGGKVVTTGGHWYQLGNPASVLPLPPVPAGFFSTTGGGVINDNGDQAHFLVTSGSQNLIYPFRLSNGGAWQSISGIPTGRLSAAGLGSINLSQDISFTAGGVGLIAAGPNGVGQPLAALISPAYPGATVGGGGPMNNAGQILTSVMIGLSPRLMKMTPASPCGSNCMVSSALVMKAVFVQDPANPGSCFQGGKMYTTATVTATFTDEAGAALANVQASGRFLDDKWANSPVSGTTNASGAVTFSFTDLCGVGAIAFLVDKATLGTRTLDRTRGVLSTWEIPIFGWPSNQPPVAHITGSCNATTRSCNFNGSTSTDDVGIVSYSWTFGDGSTGTGVTPSHTYAAGGSYQVTLTVADAGGLTSAATRTVTLGTGTNLPPVAAWTVSCLPVPAHTCTVDGTTSHDPDGTIVAFRWTNAGGVTLSTLPTLTRTFLKSGTLRWTLTVTDNGGKTGKLTKTITVP